MSSSSSFDNFFSRTAPPSSSSIYQRVNGVSTSDMERALIRSTKYNKEMLFFDRTTCMRCLKSISDGELKMIPCELDDKKKDRICEECINHLEGLEQAAIDDAEDISPNQEGSITMQEAYINSKRKYGDRSTCKYCSPSYRWLIYMNSPGDMKERCHFCKDISTRSFLKIYPASDVCIHLSLEAMNKEREKNKEFIYQNAEDGESDDEFNRRFHLSCMDCYNKIQESKSKDEYKECKACTNGLTNMTNILTYDNKGKKTSDGNGIIIMNYLLVDPTIVKYTECAKCKIKVCDVNYSYLFKYKCTDCNEDTEKKESGRHAVCKDCSVDIIHKLESQNATTLDHSLLK